MNFTGNSLIEQLVAIETHVHYGESPPPSSDSFIFNERQSRVLVSAPHGSRCFRDKNGEVWHEEDEFTAGMALLLAERCRISVIANVWRSDTCDPNAHPEDKCLYKQRLRKMVEAEGTRWVLDLHGAAEDNPRLGCGLVDLGTRKKERPSMEDRHRDMLRSLLEVGLGPKSVSINGFPASGASTITAFCQDQLSIQAVQIEMKPSVRVPQRRVDASSYAKAGPYAALPAQVTAMLSSLEFFVTYLKNLGDEQQPK